MIVPKQEMMTLTGESDSFDLDFTHRGVEKEVKNYCGWEIESATYTNKLVDGTGTSLLDLGLKNVTALPRTALNGLPAIKIKHSIATNNAFAKIIYTDSAPVSLELTADPTSSSLAFSSYATLTTLIAQITGDGWSGEVYDTDYNGFPSTVLLEIESLACGTWDGTDPGWSYLYMAGRPISDYELNRDDGSLYRNAGWPSGVRNIPVTVTAGWTTANMPADLKQAVAMLVKYFYNRHQQDATGIKSFSLGHLKIEYLTEKNETGASSIPIEILDVLDLKYKVIDLL